MLKIKYYQKIFPLVPFLFSFYLVRFKLFGIPTNLLEFFLLTLFVLLIFTKGKKIKVPLLLPLSLFLGSGILGILVVKFLDGNLIKSLGWWKGFMFVPTIFFVLVGNLNEKNKLKLFKNFILSSSLLGIASFFSTKPFTVDGRLSGFFESANFLAFSLSPALLMFFALNKELILNKKKITNCFLKTISITSILIPLFLTQSYLAISSCVLLISLWKVLEFREKKKFDYKIFLGIFLFLVLFIGFFYKTEKFQKAFDLKNRSSISVRAQVYRISLDFLVQHPFLGIGLGNYEKKYLEESPEILGHTPFEWTMRHTHNLFISIWLNIGFLGLVSFLSFFYLAIKKDLDKEKILKIRPHLFLKSTPLFYFALHGLLDTPFWKNDLGIIFFLCLGFIILDDNKKSEY